jgi:diguanylate cyclase (GGDEF)-like protein
MTKASENIRLVQYLRRRLLPLAAGIALLLALLGPITYWIIEHRSLHRVTQIYAVNLAEHFQHLILESPELWKYQPYKFIKITREFHPDIDVLGFSILDEKGAPLTLYEYKEGVKIHGRELTFLEDLSITRGSAPIMFNNRRVGTVEIFVSDAPLQRACALLLCFSALVGAGLALLVYRVPVRVMRRMEGDILELVDTVERSEEELQTLYRISLATSRTIVLEQLLADILQSLDETEILPFEIKGSIFLREGEWLRLASALSLSEQAVEPCREIRLDECLCGRAAASGEMVISSDSLADERHTRCIPGIGVHGHIVIPLKAAGRVVGVLNLFISPGFVVNEHQLTLFSAIGSQVGIAINNARLYEETRAISLHDPLTGLANRRFMEIQLAKCFDAAKRYGKMIAIIMADIDHFKAFNDSHGHPAGDRLLEQLAVILVRETRDADYVFRYGGEEFLLLLPWTDAAAAIATAERLRVAVEGELGVTISLGVVSCQQGLTDKENLIHLADEALYRAKQNGRNRVEAGG